MLDFHNADAWTWLLLVLCGIIVVYFIILRYAYEPSSRRVVESVVAIAVVVAAIAFLSGMFGYSFGGQP